MPIPAACLRDAGDGVLRQTILRLPGVGRYSELPENVFAPAPEDRNRLPHAAARRSAFIAARTFIRADCVSSHADILNRFTARCKDKPEFGS